MRLTKLASCGLLLLLFLCSGFSCDQFFNQPRTRTRSGPSFSGPWLSRTRGQRNKNFSSEIKYGGNFISTPEFSISKNFPLPPGISLNKRSGLLSGIPKRSGFWIVEVRVRDRYKGTIGHPTGYSWTKKIEIKIFDKLSGER